MKLIKFLKYYQVTAVSKPLKDLEVLTGTWLEHSLNAERGRMSWVRGGAGTAFKVDMESNLGKSPPVLVHYGGYMYKRNIFQKPTYRL